MNRVRYYVKGDDTGKLISETFETSREMNEFISNYGEAIEIFSVEGGE